MFPFKCSKDVCKDCYERRDKIKFMEYWEKVGLPKSEFSICKESCDYGIIRMNGCGPGGCNRCGKLKNIERTWFN
jgi:hypothetical protein|tara:strand:- start:39 stop:263 length:225 start_codon:yes stop_codon:yes gene_type:complete